MSMLSRWLKAKQDADERRIPTKRPHLASECETVPECERWRRQIIKEIGDKIVLIQNGINSY